MAEPPKGVISGDSIPRENEEDDRLQTQIENLVAVMKERPEYRRYNDDVLREIAKEKLT